MIKINNFNWGMMAAALRSATPGRVAAFGQILLLGKGAMW